MDLDRERVNNVFANWQSNIFYHLSLCNDFAPYLDSEWGKQSVPNRGFTDDGQDVL